MIVLRVPPELGDPNIMEVLQAPLQTVAHVPAAFEAYGSRHDRPGSEASLAVLHA